MAERTTVDKAAVRRSFDRAAGSYDAAAVLQAEVARRMLARLDYIRLDPAIVIDAGCGTGNAWKGLEQRFPRAGIVGLDIAEGMIKQALSRAPWWKNVISRGGARAGVCADLEALPIATASVDLVWSNVALQWVNDLPRVISDVWRVLRPGGLFMFSTFGPDTLKELRSAYEGIDGATHVNTFVDMHDIGDMLVSARFADPVMDMEPFTMLYDDVPALMRELKAIGAHNVTEGRSRGLTGRRRLAAIKEQYESFRSNGKLPATFEVVYGHAWKPAPRVGPGGRPVIDIRPAGK